MGEAAGEVATEGGLVDVATAAAEVAKVAKEDLGGQVAMGARAAVSVVVGAVDHQEGHPAEAHQAERVASMVVWDAGTHISAHDRKEGSARVARG